MISDSLKVISANVRTRIDEDQLSAIIVYNPLNWPRTDCVDIEIKNRPPTSRSGTLTGTGFHTRSPRPGGAH